MSDPAIIMLLTLAALFFFAAGTPLMLIIGLWVIGMQLIFDFPLANVGSAMFQGLNSFALLAAPLFILTGDLISAGGIARRMSDFALSILGWIRGGLGMASIAACGMFAAISGSNAATIGSITYPTMCRQGYEKHFAAATAAAGGTVGIIIPPSILFIPFHFAVIFLIGDSIGFITPPYGLNLYVASGITGLPYFRIVRQVIPYLFSLLIVWGIVAMVPDLSTWLVKFAGLGGAGLTLN